MTDKKITPADPKAVPATDAKTDEDKTTDRKTAQIHYGGRKSGRKASSAHWGI